MQESYLAKVAKALQNGKRFNDSGSNYLNDLNELINQGLYNNTTEHQREEQDKIDAYLKVYRDQSDQLQKFLELYHINQLTPRSQFKRWY